MNERASRIKKLICESGKTYSELEKITGVAKSSLQRYASGVTTKIPLEVIEKLENTFSVPRGYIMGWQNQNDSSLDALPDNVFPIKTKRIPLLGEIACGEPIYTNEEHGEYVMTSDEVDADLCLRAKGDSMTGARIFDGDIVFIRKQDAVDNGEIAAVIIGDEATLKRVYYFPNENKLVLNAENAAYAPLVYVGDELDSVRILGHAVAFQSLVR